MPEVEVTAITIKGLSPGALEALKHRAIDNARSPENEARALLEQLLNPGGRLQIGTALSSLSRQAGLRNEDVAMLDEARTANPAPPMWFG